jgi:hypothetical protein
MHPVRASLAALVVALAAAAAAPSSSSKRGFVGDGGLKGTVDVLTGAAWYYDYNTADPFAADNGGVPHAQFTPMWWCFKGAPAPSGTNLSHFLGYNEPCVSDFNTPSTSASTNAARDPKQERHPFVQHERARHGRRLEDCHGHVPHVGSCHARDCGLRGLLLRRFLLKLHRTLRAQRMPHLGIGRARL